MMLRLYSVLATLLSFGVGLFFFCTPRKRERLAERFGAWSLPPGRYLWFHGASVGEVNGLLPLIERVRQLAPEMRILLTATTVRGLERGVKQVDEVRLLPFDSPLFIRRALRGVELRALIIAETELWPSLLVELAARHVPVALANARISDYTAQRYQRARWLFERGIAAICCVGATEELSRSRFSQMGVPLQRTQVTGHTKYDVAPRESTHEARALRVQHFGEGRRLVVLGSLRPGEEEWWFSALSKAMKRESALAFVLAPRHLECMGFFEDKLKAEALNYEKWSVVRGSTHAFGASILLLDTFGELERWYAAADAAFIGATCVDIGGHNPLEAAQYGVPIIVGPYTSVIEEPVQALQAAQALFRLGAPADAEELLYRISTSEGELKQMGKRAAEVAHSFRGATANSIALLRGAGILPAGVAPGLGPPRSTSAYAEC